MSTWPTHPDGTNKTVGEMTKEERREVMRAAAERMAAKFNSAEALAAMNRELRKKK